MNRFAACIEYDGTDYSGWQRQGHIRNTIQEHVEQALSFVANERVSAQCAGRTDKGVHATQQIIHFDTDADRNIRSWVLGTNTNLPRDISIRWVKPVTNGFHARFKALSREYHYVINNSPLSNSALNRVRATWDYRPLDADRMQRAGNILLGEHDFTSFRAVECQSKTPVKTIHRLQLERKHNFIIMVIEANAFLHHMVRNIMGVLTAVGAGVKPTSWVDDVLHARDRRAGGVTAPANGLYLTHVAYPEEYNLPDDRSGIILFK